MSTSGDGAQKVDQDSTPAKLLPSSGPLRQINMRSKRLLQCSAPATAHVLVSSDMS